jgi:osmoprotectant transport system ATP-binding protein
VTDAAPFAPAKSSPPCGFDLRAVTKRFGDKIALQPTTLELAAGGSLALLGTSGCGKSTLLRILIGLITPDAGTVEVLGTPVTHATVFELRRRIGYVIQDGGLFPHLSARDNVALMPRRLGWSADRVDARLAELADLVRLEPALLLRFPAELSGGQRQRVGIMRALALDPELLLLDEPLGALDPIVRAALQEDLRGIFARLEKTVLLVTHDLTEAAFLARSVALMRAGEIVQRGSIQELLERPRDAFVREFLLAQRKPWWGE